MKTVLGTVYRHYKGGLYEIITLAKMEADGALMVVYKAIEKNDVWIRPYNEWAIKFKQEPLLLIPEIETNND